MGQKVHPNGLRVGVIRDWNSKWYADSKNFSDFLIEDNKIRKYVKSKLFVSGISKVEIERTAKFVKVNVYTAKPGLVIGKGGNLAETLKSELEKMINKEVNLNIVEVKNIDVDAQLVAENIAGQRILELNGFVCEGTLRAYRFWGGCYHDSYLYSYITQLGRTNT